MSDKEFPEGEGLRGEDESPSPQPSEEKGPDSEKVVINLGNMFSSGVAPKRGNSENLGAMPSFYVDPSTIDPDTGNVREPDAYNTRYEVLAKASTQVPEDSFIYGVGEDELVEPPYNLSQLVNLNEISAIRNSCIVAIAQNTVGLGFRIKKIDPAAELVDSDEISEKIADQLEKWAARDEKTFTELLYAVKYDEETTGNGYIEVSRNRRGEIDGLYHVPADTIRIRQDRSGYVQERNEKKVPFYRFGDKVKLLSDGTIEFLPDREPGINEIIHFKLQSPRSQYYGIPRDVGVFVTIAGDEMARNHNIKFFTHSAVPDLLLVFEIDTAQLPGQFGDAPVEVEIPEDVKFQIIEHFRRNLSTSFFEPGLFYLPMGIRMRVERISQGQKDSGWVKYRDNNRNEIRMAFRVPGIMIADVSDGGYATAAIAKSLFLEQVVGPEQNRYSERLMRILWPELSMIHPNPVPPTVNEDATMTKPEVIDVRPANGVGVNHHIWILEFKRMSIADQAVVAQTHNIYGNLGVLQRDEIRADLGRKPLGDDEGPDATSLPGGEGPGGRPPDPNDITGLAGREGGGRGPNGTMSNVMPKRVDDVTPDVPDNIDTLGLPVAKRIAPELEEEILKAVSDGLAGALKQVTEPESDE